MLNILIVSLFIVSLYSIILFIKNWKPFLMTRRVRLLYDAIGETGMRYVFLITGVITLGMASYATWLRAGGSINFGSPTIVFPTKNGGELYTESKNGQIMLLPEAAVARFPASAQMNNLKNVDTIIAAESQIDSIPARISMLANLKVLNLKNSRVSFISEEVCRITSLELLDLTGNPVELSDIDKLKNCLPNCKVLF
jgi:hypothetical protein